MSLLTNVLKLWRTGQYLLPADSGFMVKHLFANGEPGFAKLDFSGFAGMYQDRARTIPYTAVEQPLGSFTGLNGVTATAPADVNRGVVSARVNLLTKTEDFSDAAWTKTATSVSGDLLYPQSSGTFRYISQPATTTSAVYTISFLVKGSGKTCGFIYIHGTSTYGYMSFDLSDLSVSFSAGSISTGSGSVTAAEDGFFLVKYQTGSALNIGSGSGIGVVDAKDSVYVTANGFDGLLVKRVSLSSLSDANLPYQRVNTPTDYDTAGFHHYLKFNGTNTAYVTPSIDFTGTDKMTVWAGVTKLSDAARGSLLELSAGATNLIRIEAPSFAGSPNYFFGSVGSAQGSVTASGIAAPNTSVLTGVGDIAGDVSILRVNSIQAGSSATDQGTGNYGNDPLYIGGRAGTSLFFNGRLYSLIVRGTQSSLSQIEAVETLIHKTMRLP